MGGLGELPHFGPNVKAGIGHSLNNLKFNVLVEYFYLKENGIMFSGSRTYKTIVIHPHLLIGYNMNKIKSQIFIFSGVGPGNFEINNSGNIIKEREMIWSIGSGIKYRFIALAIGYFGPEVILCEVDNNLSLPVTICYPMNNDLYIILNLLFEVNLN